LAQNPSASTRLIHWLVTRICLLAVATALLWSGGEVRAQIIRRVSAPGKYYADDKAGNGVVYNYAAYTISNNTAATVASVYVAITNIVSTNRITLANTDTGFRA